MAVYERTYGQYSGQLTPSWSRFLIIPRHAYKDIFQSKLFVGFFVSSFVYPLALALFIYLHHNASALAILKFDLEDLIPININFFYYFKCFEKFKGHWRKETSREYN